MAKLTNEQIESKLNEKGFTLVNADEYKNKQSKILIKCLAAGHLLETNLDTVDHTNFMCPECAGITQQEFTMTKTVPPKKGYRIIALDQATEKLGVSIYDSGKLVYCDLIRINGDLIPRLSKIQKLINNIIIPNWQPDLLMFEDIQQQHGNVLTYKILSMLLGICQVAAFNNGIEFDTVAPTVWRSYIGITSKERNNQKQDAVKLVRQLYNINVIDDTAEAILIGRYATIKHKSKRGF